MAETRAPGFPPSPSMPARSPTRPPARGRRRSTRRHPSSSTTSSMPPRCSACRRSATSTRASSTRPRRCWRSASRRSRAARRRSPSPQAMRRKFLVFHTLMQPGDEIVASQEALWRLDQPVQPFLQELRLEREVGRSRRSFDLRSARSRRGPRRSSSNRSPIPAASSPTSRRSPRSPTTRRRAAHRRQHAGHALPDPAVRARRRHHRAFR